MAKHADNSPDGTYAAAPDATRIEGVTPVERVHDRDRLHDERVPADRLQDERVDDGREPVAPATSAVPAGAVVVDDAHARDKFGGLNIGAAFFGWIVAIGVAILLAGIVGAVLTAVNSSIEVTQTEAERQAGTIGVSTAVVLLVILALAYYAGGYVAGRMSRFDGARQGVGVWVLGLVVSIVAVVLGAVFGDDYDVLSRVDLPRIPFSTDEITTGAIVAGLAVIAVTLVSAILGGLLGHRYHNRVDRAVRH
ncbi:hypothetical protein [Aeromicrobium fastidiosum]|uniref:Uncharacterized protein n=1 Tax=Aeromicrobium fastidiosum TaxID=52699 RepID=A0A641AM78_9ACTN|nr:hypothetical protein [Aeromicrobium fastidiosum]KAA1378223.1 hypothetical protein ESP62_007530 [Aeromicrobium fastidiosum]MBP2388967.1 membrane protease YdiL (CAAX protease family) [Aeromicrobium fastidiosum]